MRHLSKVGMLAVAASAVTIAISLGCASNPPLRTEGSTSGIRAAEEVGASDVPRAALHLQLAKEELQRARTLATNGDRAQADSYLLRAEADAELAVALSREDSERTEGQEAVARVRELREENHSSIQRNNHTSSKDLQ